MVLVMVFNCIFFVWLLLMVFNGGCAFLFTLRCFFHLYPKIEFYNSNMEIKKHIHTQTHTYIYNIMGL